VTAVKGSFERGDIVAIETVNGERVATGLVNYGSKQAIEMFGKTTKQLKEHQLLLEGDALVHRDNMALV
jgi:glutamate 5-kinase